MKIKLKTVKTFLLAIGLSSVLFYSCSSNDGMMLDNPSAETEEVLEKGEFNIQKLESVSSTEVGRSTNTTFDCSNIRQFTNQVYYSYTNYYMYVPMGSQYQYYYNAETTYVVQKYYNTGDFYYDFRIAGECGAANAIVNSKLVGTWKIYNSSVTDYDLNSQLTLTIQTDGKISLKGCNTFFGMDIQSTADNGNNDGGEIAFSNTDDYLSTRMLCADNRDELVRNILTELGKIKYWIEHTGPNGERRVGLQETSNSFFGGQATVALEFISQ
ncbi:META domain-containing protein [Tenacibaculum sp. MAR_2009_124]|uniref:META domain-containing protein n=1 Tax=Tenacibaculum sp. MAR_2009_124 TaxID=1250059 RepID=UPI0008956901|nr:META domain-containing protein [Tenacibaculum sp. MAR_2009_124]SEC39633.1 META domain-containing protein [Tenacibaculum sp. MAR_2009_124]